MTLARSKKILKSAKGEDCTLRLVGICNFNPETTVAAHVGVRRGMGIKCGDNFIVYACSNCHAVIDSAGREQYAADKMRALEETQEKLIEKELLVIE
ncbi:Putative nuclease YbcO [Allocatenococcus thiocycli]|nr:Putative nuclease YbcO [Catenococcus thiocycli]